MRNYRNPGSCLQDRGNRQCLLESDRAVSRRWGYQPGFPACRRSLGKTTKSEIVQSRMDPEGLSPPPFYPCRNPKCPLYNLPRGEPRLGRRGWLARGEPRLGHRGEARLVHRVLGPGNVIGYSVWAPSAFSCLASSNIGLPRLALHCRVLLCPALPLGWSCLVLPCLALLCLVLPCLVLSRLVLPCLVLRCRSQIRSARHLVWAPGIWGPGFGPPDLGPSE